MKFGGTFWLAVSSALLVALTILAYFGGSFPLAFFTMLSGQACLLIAVYRVLREPYTSSKTFDDFYEDHPSP
ncbi:MAG: hypothetical protein ABGW97_12030 [Christiangramia sp.]|uniref:hypothetical protein n=1 Tax=Christiangramia sp. TaxID=1931228 RepID=UPI003242D080